MPPSTIARERAGVQRLRRTSGSIGAGGGELAERVVAADRHERLRVQRDHQIRRQRPRRAQLDRRRPCARGDRTGSARRRCPSPPPASVTVATYWRCVSTTDSDRREVEPQRRRRRASRACADAITPCCSVGLASSSSRPDSWCARPYGVDALTIERARPARSRMRGPPRVRSSDPPGVMTVRGQRRRVEARRSSGRRPRAGRPACAGRRSSTSCPRRRRRPTRTAARSGS